MIGPRQRVRQRVRGWQVAVGLALALAAPACSGVGRVSEQAKVPEEIVARATNPNAPRAGVPGGSAPTSDSVGTPSTAPSRSVKLARGEAGYVELDDGTRLTATPTTAQADTIELRLVQLATGNYEASILGAWNGPVELRVPVPPSADNRSGQAFLLQHTAGGWEVEDGELRPDRFLYNSLASLGEVRVLTCPATVPGSPAKVLACWSDAQVNQVPRKVGQRIADALGCDKAWPASTLVSRDAYCVTAPSSTAPGTGTVTVPPPTPTTATTAPTATTRTSSSGPVTSATSPPTTVPAPVTTQGRMQVELSENPVVCDGTRRTFGTVSGAAPGESVGFYAEGIGEVLPGTADGGGSLAIHWRCDAIHVGRTWTLTATGQSSGRSVTFQFIGGAALTATPQAPAALSVSLSADPVTCDGTRRAFGTVGNADPGEQVAFSASGIGALLPGTADANGAVTIHWRCDPVHVGRTWTITATGQTSGRSVTFSFTGG